MTENEIWRPIEGFEYMVSSLGRVKSLERIDYLGHHRKEKILKPGKTTHGYLQVVLCRDGKKKPYPVHKLVANAFIPNTYNLETINHINEIKTDNRVSNLEWMTIKDNKRYSSAKPVNQYNLDGRFIRNWDCIMDIQYSLGFNSGNISLCCRGKQKSAYGFIWRYA